MCSPTNESNSTSERRNSVFASLTPYITQLMNRIFTIACVKIFRYVFIQEGERIIMCSTCKLRYYPEQQCSREIHHLLYEGRYPSVTCFYCHTDLYQRLVLVNCPVCTDVFRRYVTYLHNQGRSLLHDSTEIVMTRDEIPSNC